ncbi:hypothetical protein CHARACLAT_014535 [Characodon lateralis]|uniref:Osteocrin n=1 Tax=Characodon lateralis TaxID=208331 RepID=A0ABU7DSW2_9TELE|nr:hypothetical protein [Characodon lateralis]
MLVFIVVFFSQVKTSDTIDSEISALMDIHSAGLEKKQQKGRRGSRLSRDTQTSLSPDTSSSSCGGSLRRSQTSRET